MPSAVRPRKSRRLQIRRTISVPPVHFRMPPPRGARHGLLNAVPQCGSSAPIGPRAGAPYSSHRKVHSRDAPMTHLARLVNLAAVLLAVAFFAVALGG